MIQDFLWDFFQCCIGILTFKFPQAAFFRCIFCKISFAESNGFLVAGSRQVAAAAANLLQSLFPAQTFPLHFAVEYASRGTASRGQSNFITLSAEVGQ